jgi:hypothetical protein
MAEDLAGAVDAILDRLRAAGIRATSDLRNVNAPGCYLPPPAIDWRFARGSVSLSWSLLAVVPNTGRDVALKNLGPLLDQVTAALVTTPVTDGRFVDVAGVDGAAPMPGYELHFTTRHQFGKVTP